MGSRTRRTLQYAPADRSDAVQAAADCNADAVILDLESSVDESNKDDARNNLSSFSSELDFGGKEVVVRINSLRSDRWLADIEGAIHAGADTLRIPKVEQPDEIVTAVKTAKQVTDESPEFLLQLESPEGLLNGHDIAEVCADLPEVTGIGVGLGDYTKVLGVDDHTSEMRSFVLNSTAAYASVGNMDPLAYAHKNYEDLRSSAEEAKALGHVGQPISSTVDSEKFIEVLNEVYSE